VDNKDPENNSLALDLIYVTRTDYYAGLFTSSPKVTLYLARKGLNFNIISSDGPLATQGDHNGTSPINWECDVCGNKNRNVSGCSPSSTQVCVLCGVVRPSAAQSTSSKHLSIYLPTSSAVSLSSSTPTTSVACPACTFLNHPSLVECEICETKLFDVSPDVSKPTAKSTPATRPSSPDVDDKDQDPTGGNLIKVSFRKGGDKVFYTALKRSLKGKAWEVHYPIYFFPRKSELLTDSSNTLIQAYHTHEFRQR